MKRGKKLLWLLVAVAVLIGAMVLIPKLTAEEAPEPAEDTTVELLNVDVETVERLSWTYEGEVYTFYADGNRWINEEDPKFPTQKSNITTMLEAFAPLKAMSEVTPVQDLSAYGLAEPSITVTVTAAGKTATVSIGDENAMGGLRYVTLGDGKVYLVSTNIHARFERRLFDVMIRDTLPNFGRTQAVRIVEDGEETWPEVTDELLYAVSSLKFTDFASYNATDVTPYGLDDPIVLEIYYLNNEGLNGAMGLQIGDETENGTYIRLLDSQLIYLTDTETLNTILGK